MAFDRTNATQLAALFSELTTDPCALGLPQLAGADQAQADKLNAPKADRANWADGKASTFKRADVTPAELLEAIDPRDIPASITGMANNVLVGSWLESVCQTPKIRLAKDDGTNTLLRQTLNRILGDTNGSQTRLNTLAIREGSRAEALFGKDTVLTDRDIAAAFGRL